MSTTRMTVAQALVRFLDRQYTRMDGKETKFVEGIFTIFGRGIAVGLGQSLDENPGGLKVLQGRNEQGMCHAATAFAKQLGRKKIIPCASSVGPGAANMVTAATATVNNIPLLLFPADTFATRQPDPALQQLEQSASLAVTTKRDYDDDAGAPKGEHPRLRQLRLRLYQQPADEPRRGQPRHRVPLSR